VLYFAKGRELVGMPEEEIRLSIGEDITPESLLDLLCKRHSALEEIRFTVILALNMEYLHDKTQRITLKNGDEIAVIPPLSGG